MINQLHGRAPSVKILVLLGPPGHQWLTLGPYAIIEFLLRNGLPSSLPVINLSALFPRLVPSSKPWVALGCRWWPTIITSLHLDLHLKLMSH